MTKPQLVKKISEKLNFRMQDVESFLDALADTMVEAAQNDDTIALHGIFTMETVKRAARIHYDVVNNKKFEKPERKTVVIHTGSRLKAIGKDNTQ